MNEINLYEILHAKTIKRDKEVIENRNKELMNMNLPECIKHLEREIESWEENMLNERKKGNHGSSFYLNNVLELYKNMYANFILDPQYINEFKDIITHEDKFGRKLKEIELNNYLHLNGDFIVEMLQQGIQLTPEVLEKQDKLKYWNFPIKREHLEKSLLEDKNLLSKLEKEPDYIYKMKENLRNRLNSLKKK